MYKWEKYKFQEENGLQSVHYHQVSPKRLSPQVEAIRSMITAKLKS